MTLGKRFPLFDHSVRARVFLSLASACFRLCHFDSGAKQPSVGRRGVNGVYVQSPTIHLAPCDYGCEVFVIVADPGWQLLLVEA